MIETKTGATIGVGIDGSNAKIVATTPDRLDAACITTDYQGVTALIKELEEVREKLPKPKKKFFKWLVLSKQGSLGSFTAEEAADCFADEHGGEVRKITWEVDDE